MTVAEYICKFLISKNIKYVFGFQGSAMLKIAMEISKSNQIQYLQNFHEQASSFASNGYARVAGEPGVAIATSGPGAANLIGGIADAYFDSVPVFFLTGQYNYPVVVSKSGARQNGFQDMDIVSMVRPITKDAMMLEDPEQVAYELERLWHEMTEGRKGPVLLDIPINLQFSEIDEMNLIHFNAEPEQQYEYKIDEALELIQKAERPLFIAGGGIRQANAIEEFNRTLNISGIPAVTSMQGMDVCDGAYGVAGLYGCTHANIAVFNSDLLVVLGCRFGVHHTGKDFSQYTNGKIIHVDIDESELNRVTNETLSIRANLKGFLNVFNDVLEQRAVFESKKQSDSYQSWISYLVKLKNETKRRIYANGEFDPVYIAECVLDCFSKCIAIGDVGLNQIWLLQAYHDGAKKRLINSGGYGSMGFSLPAAVGAATAKPKMPILAFMGDGGFHMNQQELLYLQLHEDNVKCIVYNNSCLGLMREIESRYYDGNYVGNTSADFCCVNLEKLALVYGIPYALIADMTDIPQALQIIKSDGPAILEIRLAPENTCINRYDEMEKVFERYSFR